MSTLLHILIESTAWVLVGATTTLAAGAAAQRAWQAWSAPRRGVPSTR